MFRRLAGNSGGLWKSKNPHSVEYLKYLHGVLTKNEKITENNKAIIIEAVRTMTEILIWGDQNDSSVFDFFLERQMLVHFTNIMKQKCGGYVNVQLLQTLNIMFENLRNETSLYFLLSNNHVNLMISHPFDFDNEELLAYYVSFLKTLSFKLNLNTVHFFFNETTHEFPLFTEALKFFNHSESMVRIAVRTITLNVFRLKDEGTMKFVVSRAQDYFTLLAKEIARQNVEMDTFARSAQNELTNRERLLNMIDIHLDNMHYLNDILLVQNEELNALLVNSISYYVISPLYLASLASLRETISTILLSKVSALFLLSHLILTIHDEHVVQAVLTPLFFGDENDIRSHWVRHVEKGLYLEPSSCRDTPTPRLFFCAHLDALVNGGDDHCTLYALLLVYSICQNKGTVKEVLEAAQFPSEKKNAKCDKTLSANLLYVLEKATASDTSLRPITLELCCIVIRGLVLALEDDNAFIKSAADLALSIQNKLARRLNEIVFTEDLFLEMFEEEHYLVEQNTVRMDSIASNASLYLPPSSTPLSKIPLSQRLPCGNEERIRRTLQFFFILRRFAHDLLGEREENLPLNSKVQAMAELDDCINLNNCDLLACYVSTNKNEKASRFLVTDRHQLILVEPDKRKLGWAIVRFSGLLQDTHVSGDPNDGRTLHVVVEDVKCRSKSKSSPQLSAKLIFDDHIRCMAAKQRLGKGRKTSRQHKLQLISALLGGSTKADKTQHNEQPAASSPIKRNHTQSGGPGSLHLMTKPENDTKDEYSNNVPDDPAMSPQGSVKHL
ncbi:FPL domain-containing protein [Aphelenchoides besseyi]|nr:FPL domain-containing protein [Aphelenchoides besseyi]KAI6201295.1 FPL domain-containing protein [Aphelenchoides besseyi]